MTFDSLPEGLPLGSVYSGSFVPPCATARTVEWIAPNGRTFLATRVAGCGWIDAARLGSLSDVNDAGTIYRPGGLPLRVCYDPRRDPA